MELPQIKEFFDYKPLFENHPQVLVDQIISIASTYLWSDILPKIQYAYEFALQSHEQVLRLSGEPYIVHPLRATIFLMELKPDLETIQTCILHDVIEDTDVTYDEIMQHFGKEVADLCEWLVKVAKVRYTWEDRQLETLKKTFLAMWKDLRVILVKIADRIHNIQTLHYHPKSEKRERIALETLKVFVPIAKKLWLYHFQTYLENGAFKILHPREFEYIVSYLNKQFGNDLYVAKGIKSLTKILYKWWLEHFEVEWRLKSPYRIFEKIHKKYQMDLSSVMDVLAFRIIAPSVNYCYTALGIIHKSYTPLINKIKDYIAVPKFNGYQSIHTTIVGMFKFPVEIQIRTKDMDDVAEHWVAAHAAYSDQGISISVSEQQSQWIRKLQELVDSYQSLEDRDDFKDQLNLEVLHKEMFLYTPKWDIIEMPQGSTILDFAFRIHSDVWLKYKHGIVNGSIKPIWYKPKTWDVVEIITYKNTYSASRYWTEFLHTSTARSRLLRHFHQLDRDDTLTKGLELLNNKLKEFWLPMMYSENDRISNHIKSNEIESVLLKIADHQYSRTKLIRTYYPKELAAQEIVVISKITKTQNPVPYVLVGGQYFTHTAICPECHPGIDDVIIAKSDIKGIKIHTLSCKALTTMSFDKIIEAHWSNKIQPTIYVLQLEITIANNHGILPKIFVVLQDLHIEIRNLQVKCWIDNVSTLSLSSPFTNIGKISYLVKTLKQYEPAIKILKKQLLSDDT